MRYVIFAVLAAMTIACGPPYSFVAHAEPNPFTRPGCRAVMEPIHTEQLQVGEKSEAQYVAEKKADSADSYDADKRAADAIFHQRIADEHGILFMPGGTPDNTFIIRPMWLHWEPGYYAFVSSAPGRAHFIVDIVAPNGQPLDRIAIDTRASDMSSGGRMRGAISKVGGAVSAYIADYWVCAR